MAANHVTLIFFKVELYVAETAPGAQKMAANHVTLILLKVELYVA